MGPHMKLQRGSPEDSGKALASGCWVNSALLVLGTNCMENTEGGWQVALRHKNDCHV